ncbi:MAG: DUF3027 domain-containing protein [Beutenbergiaceae bacterium]
METSTRRAPKETVLPAAVELARAAIEGDVGAEQVGEHLGFTLDGERIGSHAFACLKPGYVGWHWSVTLARVPRSRTPSVCEVQLLPGAGALLAKPWLPWSERLAPGDLGATDQLPYNATDERLIPGHVATGDPEVDRVAILELGLDRERVMSASAIDAAATRWHSGSRGPHTAGTRSADQPCATCGFIVPLAGPLGTVFGVCVNEWSPDDGKVVSFDHGCGAHSETDAVRNGHEWEQSEPVVDELDLEVIATEGQEPS